uniref:Putative UDP-glycosyltransferase 79B6-like n=1 Tax=Davidia involucrata TaxID=16924 RepID=A0A5B7BWZ6_DAVIN
MKESDAISIRTCHEIEGPFCDYLGSQYGKRVLLTGPVLPEPSTEPAPLEERWVEWLGRFEPSSVVCCIFGSQFILEKDQFQELLLGFELTGLPFLVALKPPQGTKSIEEALPDGFEERVQGRGLVHGGWVQQLQILSHPSVGCFVHHCGFGSMWESLMSDCQIVLVPQQLGDLILNTRTMTKELKVAVEVEREENGWFTKESLCKAIRLVMDHNSDVAGVVRSNHAKWKDFSLK